MLGLCSLHTDWECSSALNLLGLLYARGSVYVCCSNQAGVHGRGLRVTHCQGTRKQCQIKALSGEPGRDCCGSNSSELFEVGGHRAAGSQLPWGLAVGTGAPLGAHKVHRWTGPVPGSFPKHSSSREVCAAGITHALCPCPAALHCTRDRARVCCCWYQNLVKNVVYPLSLCQLDPSREDRTGLPLPIGSQVLNTPTGRDAKTQDFGLTHFRISVFQVKIECLVLKMWLNWMSHQ